MKKRMLAGILILSTALAFAGCGQKASDEVLETASKVVALGDYKGLEMKTPEVTDAQIEEYINTNLLTPEITYEKITKGKVKKGDLVNIDYKGLLDGEAFTGGTDTDFNLEIGSNSFIDGFEEGLIGVKAGEQVDLNLTFPENSSFKEVSGKDVVFQVTVNYICGDEIKERLEFNDELVKSKTDYENVTDYKAYVNDTLTENNKTAAKREVWDRAVENAEISDYPEAEMDAAYETMMNYYNSMASYYGAGLSDVLAMYGTSEETFQEDMKESAQKTVASKLVALAIAASENYEITDGVYEEKLNQYVADYGFPSVDELKKAVPEKAIREQIYVDYGQQFVFDNAVES